ncbi:MAG TPA: SDR family NAD(P)-dependent oxidoreductase [Euzebyales bacterium]|nr:SDR family NAD(P)-dependent oxidoreductase [Euzebyales bacterium]
MNAGTVVVTGAATGIGRRAAVQLAGAGRHVIVMARSDERAAGVVAEATAAARAGGRVESIPADLADLAQVRAAAERIAAVGPVQAVVNNAAILAVARRRPRITTDGIEEVFAVNHVAPFVLTTILWPHLVGDGRVVLAGSRGLTAMPWQRLDLDDLDSRRRWSPVRAYYRSKLAQLAFAAELRRRGVVAAALQIPSVRLDQERLAAYPPLLQLAYRPKMRFAADPAAVAARYVELATGPIPPTGHVDARLRPVRWPDGTGDAALGAQVWSLTKELAGQRSDR